MPLSTQTVDRLIEKLKDKVKDRHQRERLQYWPRDAHAVHHGIVIADFEVNADAPADLRKGLFATPKAYRAFIRFSNAGGEDHDAELDFRGMAIKVTGVEGKKVLQNLVTDLIPQDESTTQDFHLVDCPVFFAKNAEHMSEFLDLRRKLREAKGWTYYRLNRQLGRRFPETLRFGLARNLLGLRYFSQTPYRLGETLAVKYQARPREIDTWPSHPGHQGIGRLLLEKLPSSKILRLVKEPRYLRHAMATMFQRGEDVVFDFMVQRQTGSMPIEDPTIEWDEAESPFSPVATITIHAKDNVDFLSVERMALAETMSFSPWHSLIEHEPLGEINQARLQVYRQMAQYRHEGNRIRYHEPSSTESAAHVSRMDT